MEPTPQSEVLITPEAQNIKPPKKWGKIFVIFPVIILVSFSMILLLKYQNLLKTGFKILNNPNAQTPSQTVQVTQKINTKLKSGEFLIQEPTKYPNISEQKPEQQVIVKGTLDIANNGITIEDVSSQTTARPLDTSPIATSIPWIIIETSVSGEVNYFTRFPLIHDEGQTVIPFLINLPYEKQFDLNIYDQEKKLLFSQPINL